MNKHTVRVLGIFGILTTVALISSLLVTKVLAHGGGNTNKQWTPSSDWGVCVSTGPQCGTDNGKQTRTLTCMQHNGGNDSCSLGTWVPATYTCDIHTSIHGTSYDVSEFYNKPTGDSTHCHRIVWGDLGETKQNDFKNMHHNDHDYSSPNHGNWTSAYTSHTDENPSATVDVAGHFIDPETKPEDRSCQTGVTDNRGCEVSPTPEITPEVTPTEEPTPTPEQTQPSTNVGGPGDGLSDGRSDGLSSCPECTKAPTGQVLGATTDFAGTGVASDMIMNAVGALGGISTAAGLALKKRSN